MRIFFSLGCFESECQITGTVDVVLKFAVEVLGGVIGILMVAVCFAFARLDMKTKVIISVSGSR